MAIEIERKFLLANEGWRAAATRSDHLIDGLITRSNGGKVRVRLGSEKAWLTVKGARHGIARSEFEYEIPLADAAEMIQTVCDGPAVEKIRYTVPFADLVWSVDVHMGPLAGIEFAEVELRHADEFISLPPWAGAEITHDPRFRKETLLRRCAEAARPRPEIARHVPAS
jgi:CYTH domain-containing protein